MQTWQRHPSMWSRTWSATCKCAWLTILPTLFTTGMTITSAPRAAANVSWLTRLGSATQDFPEMIRPRACLEQSSLNFKHGAALGMALALVGCDRDERKGGEAPAESASPTA